MDRIVVRRTCACVCVHAGHYERRDQGGETDHREGEGNRQNGTRHIWVSSKVKHRYRSGWNIRGGGCQVEASTVAVS